MGTRSSSLLVVALLAAATAAPEAPPSGLVAVVGEHVVLLSEAAAVHLPVPAGAVVLPGPGGQLLAPDQASKRTTVLDLGARRIADWLPHATELHFGDVGDRAVVVEPGLIRLVSYPDGAEIARVEARLQRPGQVQVGGGALTALILDLGSQGQPPSLVVAALQERQVTYRALTAGVTRFDLAPRSGLITLVEPATGRIQVVHPGEPGCLFEVRVEGAPVAAALVEDGEVLIAAVADRDGGGGRLERWRLKRGRGGRTVSILDPVELTFAPTLLAPSPDRRWVAVAGAETELVVVEARRGRVRARHDLPGVPRQLLWPDLEGEAPLLPQWSEGVR